MEHNVLSITGIVPNANQKKTAMAHWQQYNGGLISYF